jgi:hypothetical protein
MSAAKRSFLRLLLPENAGLCRMAAASVAITSLNATLFGMISFSLRGVAEWLQNTQKRPLYFRGTARFGIGGAGAQCGSELSTQS